MFNNKKLILLGPYVWEKERRRRLVMTVTGRAAIGPQYNLRM
jgi:hypothetical protein